MIWIEYTITAFASEADVARADILRRFFAQQFWHKVYYFRAKWRFFLHCVKKLSLKIARAHAISVLKLFLRTFCLRFEIVAYCI